MAGDHSRSQPGERLAHDERGVDQPTWSLDVGEVPVHISVAETTSPWARGSECSRRLLRSEEANSAQS